MACLVEVTHDAAQTRSSHDRLTGVGDGGRLTGSEGGAIGLEPERSAPALPAALLGGLAPSGADPFALVLTLESGPRA